MIESLFFVKLKILVKLEFELEVVSDSFPLCKKIENNACNKKEKKEKREKRKKRKEKREKRKEKREKRKEKRETKK
jgi:hypothetical protein